MSDFKDDLFTEEERLFQKSDILLEEIESLVKSYKKILSENERYKNRKRIEPSKNTLISSSKADEIFENFSLFIKSNKKVLKQTRKLVKISDRQQQIITESNQKFEAMNIELSENNKRIIELNNTKDIFFSIISHDLRGPIGSSKSFLEVLFSNKKLLKDDEKCDEILGVLYNTIKQTFNLLDNLLYWARSQKGDIRYNPIKLDLNKIIDQNIELVYNNAKFKEISLIKEDSGEIFAYADSEMISAVIRNLLSNAVKFTNFGGIIKIGYKIENNAVKIYVSDNGVGISEDNLNKIFKIAYKQSTLGTNKETGTGLGLILCKEFVEKNNGTIDIESRKNQGTRISFSLPLCED